MNDNTKKKAALVQAMLAEHHEPERQDRCKLWVYRNHVRRVIPMSERTFWRYLNVKLDAPQPHRGGDEDENQLKLF